MAHCRNRQAMAQEPTAGWYLSNFQCMVHQAVPEAVSSAGITMSSSCSETTSVPSSSMSAARLEVASREEDSWKTEPSDRDEMVDDQGLLERLDKSSLCANMALAAASRLCLHQHEASIEMPW